MANTVRVQTTYEVQHVIEPIYTNGGVALSHDGRILATCVEGDVVLTDLRSGGELARIEGDGEIVTTLAITPNGSHIVICSRSLSTRIYSLEPSTKGAPSLDATLTWTLKPHDAPVVSAAIDDSGALLATGGADGVVKVWDIKRSFMTHTFHGHSGLVSTLKFFKVSGSETQDGKRQSKKQFKHVVERQEDDQIEGWRLASGGEDGKVRIWDLKTRKSVASLDSHVSVVRKLDYSVDENALLSASRDKTVMVWDCKTWKRRMTLPVFEEIETAGFLAEGTMIYTGGEQGSVRLWELDTSRELTISHAPKSELEAIQDSISIHPLPFLLTVLVDQTIVLYDVQNLAKPAKGSKIEGLQVVRRINGNHGQIVEIAFVGADKSCLALATNSEDVRVINLRQTDTNAASKNFSDPYFGSEIGLLKGHTDIVISMDVDWSGHWLATGSKDNTARLWRVDPKTNAFEAYETFTGHAESVSAVALASSAPLVDSALHQDPFNHPPSFLLTGAQDKTIKKWEILKSAKNESKSRSKPRALFTRKAHEKDINAMTIHPGSTLFASASQDRTVKIWSVEDGSTVGVLRGHRRGVWSVNFSPPGTQLNIVGSPSTSSSRGYALTGSGDKTVRIWSMMDFSCLITLEGHSNSVLKVIWLPPPAENQSTSNDKRGPLIASAGSDTLIKIWEANSGECATTLDNHTDRVWTLATGPLQDTASNVENVLVSGSGDGALTFWRDTTSATAEQARARQTIVVETDQKLDNLVYSKNYREAIVLALQLDQPARLLSLFRSVADTADFASDSSTSSFTGSVEVDDAIATLADDQLYRLLLRCRDWSASARTALIAQRVLRTVVERIDMSRLSELKAPRGMGFRGSPVQLSDILRGLRAYSERHYARISDMWDESFMVEFTLREMESLLANGNSSMTNGHYAERKLDQGSTIK